MEVVNSINNVPIRLTSERWLHITENHDDLAGRFHDVLETVAQPALILEGREGELLAVQKGDRLSLAVVYREVSTDDGFVITAFQTSKLDDLLKLRKIIWRKQ